MRKIKARGEKQLQSEATILSAQKSKGASHAHLLSLLGGAVFFSLVVGLAISRNERVRAEIDTQIQSFLETTRNALVNYQQLALKIEDIGEAIKTAKLKSKNKEVKLLSSADSYDLLWQEAEKVIR